MIHTETQKMKAHPIGHTVDDDIPAVAQYEPAGHAAGAVAPVAQKEPVAQAVWAESPEELQ